MRETLAIARNPLGTRAASHGLCKASRWMAIHCKLNIR